MSVFRPWIPAALLFLLVAGCSDSDRAPLGAETDDPSFRQGQQLARQGRPAEALTAFLRVIEKRGERNAPESHFEAGLICLRHTKDPIEAIYHFRKYRELKPNTEQAKLVRQQEQAAIREFAARLPAPAADDQSVRVESAALIERLQRENEELKAERATLRGGAPSPPPRANGASLITGVDARPRNPAPAVIDMTAAPVERPLILPAAPSSAPPVHPAKPTAPAAAQRTYTVAAKDTLYGLSVRFYGHGRNVEKILEANRAHLPDASALKPGMVIVIPADGATPAGRR